MAASRLPLPEVTLVCIDCVNVSLALDAMRRCLDQCDFARAILFTSATGIEAPEGIDIVQIPPIRSKREYSVYLIKQLPQQIASSHVLVMQWDGFVVNASAWDPAFLGVDYIGAPWPPDLSVNVVGNGGFSLRSKRLLDAMLADEFGEEQIVHEDQAICTTFREILERDHDIHFASPELAARFSHETTRSGQPTFGFHGPQNLAMYWDSEAINRFVHLISRPVLKHPEVTWLARHLYDANRYKECGQVAAAALVEQPGNSELLDILANLRDRTKPHDYMARSEQRFLVGMLKRHLPEYFRERRVLEIGRPSSRTTVREWFDASCHIVVAHPPAPDQDGEGAEVYSAASASFDAIVSCETLEHLPHWRETIQNALRLLKPDGLLVLTCAGLGRRQHETPRYPAPDGSQCGAFYRNLSVDDISTVANFGHRLGFFRVIEDRVAHDLYVIGLGKDAPTELLATLSKLVADMEFLASRKHVFGLY